MYIVETYLEDPGQTRVIVAFIGTLVAIFGVDYLFQFLISEDRLAYVLSFFSLVDLISVPPMLLPILIDPHLQNPLVEFFMTLRVLRILKVYKLLIFSASEIQRRMISLGLTFGILVYLSAAFVSAMERYYTVANFPVQPASLQNFHDSLYFMVASFTTVGYGDVKPTATPTRVVVMTMLVIYMVLLPIQISRVAKTIEAQNVYRKAKYSPNRKQPHIVLTGHVSYASTVIFLRELFNNSLETKSTRVVILTPVDPTEDFRNLLRNPLFQGRVFYLLGSPLDPQDLFRAQLHLSDACFVMKGPSASDDLEEDTKMVMFSVAIKKLFPDLPLFVQVTNSFEKEDIISNFGDRIFCTSELKMSLLARSCVAPGSSTLIFNILRSCKIPPSSLGTQIKMWTSEYGILFCIVRSIVWLVIFSLVLKIIATAQGCTAEMHSFRIPKKFDGYTFAQLALELHTRHDATLVGFQGSTPNQSYFGSSSQGDQEIRLPGVRVNPPGKQVLKLGDVVFALSSRSLAFLGEDSAELRAAKLAKSKSRTSFFRSVVAPSEETELMEGDEESEEELDLISQPEGPLSSSRGGGGVLMRGLSQPLLISVEEGASGSPFKLAERPVDLREVIVEEATLTNHIIVCGFSSSLHHFVSALRLKSLRACPPILILAKEIPSPEAWKPISRFSDVFVMKGNATLPLCLLSAGVKTCLRVVVIAPSAAAPGLEADADSLLIGKNLQGDLQQLFVVIEISESFFFFFFKISPPFDDLFCRSGEESNIEFMSPLTSTWQGRMNRTRSILNDNCLSHEKRTKLVNLGRRAANQE